MIITNMKLIFPPYYLLILLSFTATSIAVPNYAKRGCNDTCGNVRIPYPFGIGASCSINKWYTVDCNSSTPFLSSLNHLQVFAVDLENQTVIVNMPRISDCSKSMSMDLGKSPFLFSKSHNKFVFEGCGNAFILDQGKVLTGCSASCLNDTDVISGRNNCVGISCCQTPVPRYLKSYTMNITQLEREGRDGGCGSGFLVDKNSYEQRSFSDPNVIVRDNNSSLIPVSLLWTLTEGDHISCCKTGERLKVDLGNGSAVDTLKCNISYYYEGNPYVLDECDYVRKEECARCSSSGGYCNYDTIYDVDGLVYQHSFTCNPYELSPYYASDSLDVEGFAIGVGVLFLVVTFCVLDSVIKKTKQKTRINKFFKRNGGLLLKQQEEADPSLVVKTLHFTARELQKATDNFNENRILGRGGQGTVYKGMLVDGRIIAVKKSKIVDQNQLKQFINELVILSQLNHRNVVKLLGCCLETEVPMLVSEFISNGTLYDYIHNESVEFAISLYMRLQIATEVAGAVAYLHSATSIPIYHRDIKTTNILLDENYRAKVSDFGTSRFVSMDQTHLTTLVKGTLGYLDPEYFRTSQFTEKSDVYSFGVVLVELLTGGRPISLIQFGENRSLAAHFMSAMEEGHVMSIFDEMVLKEDTRDELLLLANLAVKCLNVNGKNRPTMKEVAFELETIKRSHISSTVPTTIGSMMYEKQLSIQTYGESSSTSLSFNDGVRK